MTPPPLPDAVQTAFHLANVVPVFIVGLDREAWVSRSATSLGRTVVLIDAAVAPDRLIALADQLLALRVEHLLRSV